MIRFYVETDKGRRYINVDNIDDARNVVINTMPSSGERVIVQEHYELVCATPHLVNTNVD